MSTPARLGRAAWISLVGAVVWATGLLLAGFFLPFYQGASVTSSGEEVETTNTLVGVNGLSVVIVLLVPLVVAVLVAAALLLRDRRGAMRVAWALTILLGVLNVLALLSIGLLVVPVTFALGLACALSASPRAGVVT